MKENGDGLIEILPDEILEYVLGFLPLWQVKRNAALVCKRWYRVTKCCGLLRTLVFGPFVNTETAIKVENL